jgi:hypothetical protein
MKEKDMYSYVRDFFIERSYDVRAEVLDCDVVAVRDDVMVAIEMKTQLNIRLLAQAADRQKFFDVVYIAVPKPTFKKRLSKPYKQILHLVRRLELGLLYVDTKGEGICTEEFPPSPFNVEYSKASRSSKTKRLNSLEEFLARSDDYNVGGVVREKRITAYRENALLVALYIQRDGAMSAVMLKKLGCGEKSYSIVHDNHYGWFERVGRGIYNLTDKGKKAVKKYKHVCVNLEKTMITLDDAVEK